MNDTVIHVDSLTKTYRIGAKEPSYRTFRDVVSSSFASPFRAFGRWIGNSNGNTFSSNETIYALKDVSFDVKRGEVLGVIGRNGAGKSTLLKILSRITEPTTGYAEIHGRVGSLLEVGTGFHPELTGRENIYLNGAILGMKKAEIEQRFDEIVAFAELEKFLDTPVKHYSSGMYVRLAFAVAAHLEPEVLLVDEVLAVGDLAFQKKCLGKIGTVAKEGRTVLLVSHQMDALRALCETCILLVDGKISASGIASKVVDDYIESFYQLQKSSSFSVPENQEYPIQLTKGRIVDEHGETKQHFDVYDLIILECEYVVRKNIPGLIVSFQLSKNGIPLILSFDTDSSPERLEDRTCGRYVSKVVFPRTLLKPGNYSITTSVGIPNVLAYERLEDVLSFDVELRSRSAQFLSFASWRPGTIAMPLVWETRNAEDDIP